MAGDRAREILQGERVVMKKADILEKLRAFPYGLEGFWVITGAALVLYGIRDETADIDMGCTTEMADRLEADGCPCRKTADGSRRFYIGGDIEVFENWRCGSVIRIDRVPVLSLQGLREMKRLLGREKDIRDIRLIDEFLADPDRRARFL